VIIVAITRYDRSKCRDAFPRADTERLGKDRIAPGICTRLGIKPAEISLEGQKNYVVEWSRRAGGSHNLSGSGKARRPEISCASSLGIILRARNAMRASQLYLKLNLAALSVSSATHFERRDERAATNSYRNPVKRRNNFINKQILRAEGSKFVMFFARRSFHEPVAFTRVDTRESPGFTQSWMSVQEFLNPRANIYDSPVVPISGFDIRAYTNGLSLKPRWWTVIVVTRWR